MKSLLRLRSSLSCPPLRLAVMLALAMPVLWIPAAAAQQDAAVRLREPEAAREPLNSERIEQRFGSYGIEVLESDGRLRVSHLYSESGGVRTGRTFAVVSYPEAVDPALAEQHEEITDGGSIGAVFTRSGWTVTKRHLWFGELVSTGESASLMRIAEGLPVAAHVYVLRVARDGRAYDYATIAEVHHPEYLRLEELEPIYGPAEPTGGDAALVRRMLSATRDAMR
ncbi:MAG: hypothetical protein JXB36_15430 [Gammaproteobacteria bacterium]|nr:hypothetical protein [Gammaproteobacteria bacterium]